MEELLQILNTTGFVSVTWGNVLMILAGAIFIFLAIVKGFEPLLLVPIGFGIVVGNIPGMLEQGLGVVSEGSVLNYLYFGVGTGIYPSLIFLGIGAMTDFSTLIANPKLILLGAAAQIGIFGTFIGALLIGFDVMEAASIGIIGGADGPTSIFLASKLAPHLLGPIALAAYSYMSLVPVIQPPIMRLLTTKKERLIRMKPARQVTQKERIFFPIIAFLVTSLIAPGGVVLLAMLFLATGRVPAIVEPPHPVEGLAGAMRVLRRPVVAWFFLGMFFTVMAHVSLYAFLSLYLASLGYEKGAIGVLWVIGVVLEVGWFWFQGRWVPCCRCTAGFCSRPSPRRCASRRLRRTATSSGCSCWPSAATRSRSPRSTAPARR